MDAITAHRIHFAFTATYHYLFPPLTMGLALLIVILKSAALRSGEAHYDRAARFWGRIFAINFAMGVVTGIPLEFQFEDAPPEARSAVVVDRKSTRLNSSHLVISYAVFCLK